MIKLTPPQRESLYRIHQTLSSRYGPWQMNHVTDTYREFRKRIFHKSISLGTVSLRPIDGFEGCIRIQPNGYVLWD